MLCVIRMSFGVGTPVRIIDLLDSGMSFSRPRPKLFCIAGPNDSGALSLSALERVVVDCSHIDQKRRGILNMRETQEPLVRLLNRPELKDRYSSGEGGIQLLFY